MKLVRIEDIKKVQSIIESNQLDNKEVNKVVDEVIDNVRKNKDKALFEYTKIFDQVELNTFKVFNEEIEKAYESIDNNLIRDLEEAYKNIYTFHKRQLPDEFMMKNNGTVGNLIRPVDSVGLYVPGGTAPYPSTVLTNAAPAKVAGVKKIVMVTPPNKNGNVSPVLLAAAKIAGINEVYKVGGSQSIAALAFGTESIPKVDKIVGPGNIYVATAKKEVMGYVGIDMIAGPSEVLVIADSTANPKFIAADLLAQAEHDTMARTFLVTTSLEIAELVQLEVETQLLKLERSNIAASSISNNGYIILVENLQQAFDLANQIAPEHLEVLIKNPNLYIPLIRNAGAVFVGEYSPEPLGDYFAGPNHTLPTSGTARFQSALSTTDFIKTISYISFSRQDLEKSKDSIIRIAESEGLTAHANSIKVRFDNV